MRGSVQFRRDQKCGFLRECLTEGAQFALNDLEIAHRIAIVCVAGVNKVGNQTRSFDVAQKADAEAGAFMGALDQSWKISDHECATCARRRVRIGANYAEMGFERSKWIVGDFRPCGGDARNESGFAGVRKTGQSDIGEQSKLEAQTAFFSGLAIFVLARRLMPRLGEMGIAAASSATTRSFKPLAGSGKVEKLLASVIVENNRANRNFQDGFGTGTAMTIRAFAVTASLGAEFAIVTVAQEGIIVLGGFEDDVAAIAAIAAGGSAARDVFFTTKGNAAVAAVAAFHNNFCLVNKHRSTRAFASMREYDTVRWNYKESRSTVRQRGGFSRRKVATSYPQFPAAEAR